MAKKDNPSADMAPVVEPDVATSEVDKPAVPEVAPIAMADLAARVAELEKRGPKPASKNKLEDVPLHLCNKRYREVAKEIKTERKGIVDQVMKSLTTALGGRATNERRLQKDLAGHAAEARAAAKVDKA